MISTGLCIHDLIKDDLDTSEQEICAFIEENYTSIIKDSLAQIEEDDEDSFNGDWDSND
ncbi:MAG: hypothetical protein HQK83_17180 [Fibrobacteria bacterium]|nr:hypothetical protein [Fibrobacteria bacterium]